jgi:gliding motility-associated-like protein
MEIINVSHSLAEDFSLNVNWNSRNLEGYNKPVTLLRKDHLPQSSDWLEIGVLSAGQTSFYENELLTSERSYGYMLNTNEDCLDGLAIPPHNSVLLTGESTEDFELFWNTYNSWNFGVDRYEVWKIVDDQEPGLIYSGPSLLYSYLYESEGFDICFRIRAVELDGNNSESWSNEVCEGFFPELKAYNVFSPNGDQWNQHFIIEGIQMYPNSVLTVVNRFGKIVFESSGYQNNWEGFSGNGGLLPSGVYYWTLQLNEPRVDVDYFRGEVSILY